MKGPLTLWITYAGSDDPGDPQHAAAELGVVGIKAFYDEVPGTDLWGQLQGPLSGAELHGWAYLLTPGILQDVARREAMAFALHQARSLLGPHFPLIALLQALPGHMVPPALRGSAEISLSDPKWKEQVRAAILGEPPPRASSTAARYYAMQVHREAGGKPSQTALEFIPRTPELRHWRIGIPTSCQTLVAWGRHPRGQVVGSRTDVLDLDRNDVSYGVLRTLDGVRYTFAGCGDPIDQQTTAWALFSGRPPKTVAFARADYPDGDPIVEVEVFEIE